MTVIRTVCPHDCPDLCSILATVEDGRLVRVQGDPEHPITRGFLCGKVNRYPERVHSPERLLQPLRRTGAKGTGTFAPVTWEAALTEIVARWQGIIARHGGEALAGYAYSGHQGVINRNTVRALFHALDASRVETGTVCDSTAGAGWELAVGDTPGTDPEQIVDSDFIVSWGADLVTVSVHLVPLIARARARGATFVTIDPYRTRTAHRADRHLAPRVGTDTALALGLMHVIVRDGLHDTAFVAAHTTGFDRLCEETLPHYPPERVAAITGVAAADIEWLARRYAAARAPFIRLGQGMTRHRHGGMTMRTVALLPALVGAWDKPGGGALLKTSNGWGFDYQALRRPDLAARATRILNHSTLGRDLLELRDPPIMALFVAANNPAVTCPNQKRVAAALAREDLFTVVHDSFMTDTARYADFVLPACTAFETEDLFRSYGTYYAQFAPRVLEPVGESRSNLWLVQELARRFGFADPVFVRDTRAHVEALLAGATGGVRRLSVERLMAGSPVKLPVLPPGPDVTFFASAAAEAAGLGALPAWRSEPEATAAGGAGTALRLLTLPGHFLHHSAFSGVATLRRRQGGPRAVLHPADAHARGIRDGDAIMLRNAGGEVGLHARISDDTLPGTVAVEGAHARAAFLHGGPLNVLTSDQLSDVGAGATYQSTWVEARPMAGIAAPRPVDVPASRG